MYREDTPAEHIWLAVAKLQQNEVPINLIHSGRHTYLFAWNIDHELVEEFSGGVLAGMELSGKPITTEESFYQHADWAPIQIALHKSTFRNDQVLAILDS